ncbi:phosphoenolpyruvate--protein phosphotransferase [Brucella tritici]|jgi:phosphotransferase system enzyme I (PtsP)|uniref:phosphoenolpyruvate--protein phosphotransferase n=1 Tax=Brucella tritici TaxID=94626 RepID=A0A6L3YXP0_9HYPH|nr:MULTISPECIES: phosphoenolpyruvate--protein phosphotransferase [Brucella/Ochrobactrum group]MCH4540884.1 phosphoenolpyruvate--protein phosphotransferase [Ochrobactrum sp. A-1]KAB2656707.1 phosphoenolpyruvate--protein phosphotransferase [Brucella tritici]KAB2662779.1 phosphoenolpyruvate--protein phosphotransferase [Brucella tritici]KAB2677298.1 phosphoenolpyruvate--protein phosphotransferase [Brucella tritici]KAB2689896.1 phosphoenolpyruvate--protein phosphotransferase [Brucella tritici]
MRELTTGPRVLLKRLRELMAEPLEPQARLDRIVREIAQNMVAEVCSFYILRADGVLELYATEGLNPQAVHLAQLRLGQGLVGTIAASARPLNLTDAQSHPAFAYLPETGEEAYNSFLGVPVLRAGRTLGVLVVQNKTKRAYREDEVEALETTAMVLAEIIATGDGLRLARPGIELDLGRPMSVTGQAFNDGIGLGHVVLHEPRIVVTNLFNEDSQAELNRLDEALGSLRISIDDMLSRRDVAAEGEHREVLEAYRMFAHDRGWVRRLEEAIHNGLTAEAAVEKVQSDTRARMVHLTDPYMRERLSDFDDLANRLLRQLMGRDIKTIAESLVKDAIIVARSMGAAELLDYPRERLRGVVLEDGAATSHVVIVARAMGIPVVGQAKGIVSMAENNDAAIVDGDEGIMHLRPQSDLETAYAEKVRFRARRQAHYRELRDKPSVTKDGVDISLLMNAGLLVDLPQLSASGAAGIGLFRTELQFMVASTFPRAEQQERLYRSVIEAAGDKPVTFRTLDIGGDKVLPYFSSTVQEENPALGWRAIRLTLDRPGLLRTQLRALLKAAGGRELKILLPMITEVSEVKAAREIIDREVRHLSRFAHQLPMCLKLGAMIEVPSLLWQLEELMSLVDFISVGSNDLFQFLMATDRGNSLMSGRFDQLSPAFLRALRFIVETGNRHGKSVTLCGEMASRPLPAMALVGIGFRSISMSAAAIGPVKAMLDALDAGKLTALLAEELDKPNSAHSLRELLMRFAEDNDIPL